VFVVVIREPEEIAANVRRCEVGTRFGVVGATAEAAHSLWVLFRKAAGWAGKLPERDRGGAWNRSAFTGKKEYWIYGRIAAGNPLLISAPTSSTPAVERGVTHEAVA
jgi:hypothetical protein